MDCLVKWRGSALAIIPFLGAPVQAAAERSSINMPVGVTDVSVNVYNLHMLATWVSVAIGVAVFAVMFYSIIAHRKSRGREADHWHENLAVELAWTIIPFFILALMAWPAIKTLVQIYDTEEPEIDIVITGYQWKWKYEYLGEDVSFFSNLSTPAAQIRGQTPKGEHYLLEVDEPLHIPVGTKVRFLITANDVIHSWWVPELAVKKDAIPGIMNHAWTKANKVGTYRGQCAELCGKDHGFMPIVVEVQEKAEFDAWLAKKKADAAEIKQLMAQSFSKEELIERGKQVYTAQCAACHGANGEGGLGKAIAKSPIATGELAQHMRVAIDGVPGTAMQAFGGIINDLDMAAVITYQRNAFGNSTGDVVQAVDVFQFKKNK